jgi:hypothetical protein
MSDDILTPAASEEAGLIAYMFTNNPKEQGPFLQSLLDMFYRGVYENSLGVMSALDTETEEEVLILCGIVHDDNGLTRALPLARMLSGSEIEAKRYIAPDGEGGWLGEETEDVHEASH